MARREGHMPYLDIVEHNEIARAKRALMVGLDAGGADYRSPSVFDYVNSDPIAVVLVHPTTGTAYSATAAGTGGGGPAAEVTAYIAASVPLDIASLPSIVGTVTANLGVARDVTAYVAASEPLNIASLPEVSGTVTANLGAARDVTAHIGGSVDLTIGSMPVIAGTVTANLGVSRDVTAYGESRPSVYSDIRAITIYIPTEAGSARQLNIFTPGPWGWAITADPSNAEEVYIGPGANVNSTAEDANSGWALYPGQTAILPLDNMLVYAVCPSVTGKVHLMTVVP